MGCGCGSKKSTNSSFNCKNYGIGDLVIWKSKYQCLIDNTSYGSIGFTLDYVNSQISTLDAQITLLTNNPKSVAYCGYVTGWLSDSQKMTSISC